MFYQALINNPTERLDRELKSWIKPHRKTGKAAIVRTLFALRHNRDGGVLLIGFDDRTLQPLNSPYTNDRVREVYHPDIIQRLVSDYSYDPFEISVDFQAGDGQIHPIICVDEGVTGPAITKKSVKSDHGKVLIRKDAIYVRTLRANGTVSSSLIKPADWPDLVDTFVRNRNRLLAPSEERYGTDSVSRIAKAWDEFTKGAQSLLVRKGHGTRRTYRGLGSTLTAHGFLTEEQSAAMGRLRNLRNLAVHVPEAIRPQDAQEAKRLSGTLCKHICALS